jgi:hypothetical protein
MKIGASITMAPMMNQGEMPIQTVLPVVFLFIYIPVHHRKNNAAFAPHRSLLAFILCRTAKYSIYDPDKGDTYINTLY